MNDEHAGRAPSGEPFEPGVEIVDEPSPGVRIAAAFAAVRREIRDHPEDVVAHEAHWAAALHGIFAELQAAAAAYGSDAGSESGEHDAAPPQASYPSEDGHDKKRAPGVTMEEGSTIYRRRGKRN